MACIEGRVRSGSLRQAAVGHGKFLFGKALRRNNEQLHQLHMYVTMPAEERKDSVPAHSNNEPSTRNGPPSCGVYFERVWACYSPSYQLKEYYVSGALDDCKEHWSTFYNCLKHRTKFSGTATADPPAGPSIWRLRTAEEAAQFWEAEFGHLKNPGAAPSAQAQQDRTETLY